MTSAEEGLILAGLRALPELAATVINMIAAVQRGETVTVRIRRPDPLDVDQVLDQAERELGASPLARTEPPPPVDTERTPVGES